MQQRERGRFFRRDPKEAPSLLCAERRMEVCGRRGSDCALSGAGEGVGVSNMQDGIFSIQKNIIEDLKKKESCIIVGLARYMFEE